MLIQGRIPWCRAVCSSQAAANLTCGESLTCSLGPPEPLPAIWQPAAASQWLHSFLLLLCPLQAAFSQIFFCKRIWKGSAFSLIMRLDKQKPFVSHLTKLSLFPGSGRCLSPTGLQQEFAVSNLMPASAGDLLLCWHAAPLSLRLSHCCLASSKVQIH